MTRGAMAMKKWKKKLGNVLFFSRMVKHSAALHFLTDSEAKESAFWLRPSFVVGNGIDRPQLDSKLLECRGTGKKLNVVFIGRLDLNHKGLDLLLEALRICQKQNLGSALQVRLFGPDVGGSAREIQERIRGYALESWVEAPGPVFGEQKTNILRNADLFVLTSRFEGHPMAVLEALSYGVPCLLTPGTNVADEVADGGAGWRVEPDAGSIAVAIMAAVGKKNKLPSMAREARVLAEAHSWEVVAERTLKEYSKVLENIRER